LFEFATAQMRKIPANQRGWDGWQQALQAATIFISFLLHVALFSSRITEVRDGREPKGRIKKKEKEN
jgi:hypothetical protein